MNKFLSFIFLFLSLIFVPSSLEASGIETDKIYLNIIFSKNTLIAHGGGHGGGGGGGGGSGGKNPKQKAESKKRSTEVRLVFYKRKLDEALAKGLSTTYLEEKVRELESILVELEEK